MQPKAVFCFIDDAQFELDNFRRHAAPHFENVDFVCQNTFEQTLEDLRGRRPLGFLLDIYGTRPGADLPKLPDPADLARMILPAASPEDIYQGVGAPGGEGGNLFLRRVYTQLSRWQKAFAHSCQGLGQSREYGLSNLGAVRAYFPWAAALGYSRKALYADAAAMTLAGADGVLQKPQGDSDDAIAQATGEQAPALAGVVFGAVDRRLALEAGRLALSIGQGEIDAELGGALERVFELLFRGQGHGPERIEAGRALARVAPDAVDLNPGDRDLLQDLGVWLARDGSGGDVAAG